MNRLIRVRTITRKERQVALRRGARALESAGRELEATGVYDLEAKREIETLVARFIAAARQGEWPLAPKRLEKYDTIH